MRIPEIAIINAHEQDDAEEIANAGVGERLEWVPQRRSKTCNILPIKADGEQAKSFVTLRTAEQVGEDKAILLCQAKDRYSSEDGEYILRKDLPYEEYGKGNVKDLEAALRFSFVTVKRLEQSVDWKVDGPQHLGRMHKGFAKQPGDSVTEQLRRNDQEYSGPRRRIHVVVEFLSC